MALASILVFSLLVALGPRQAPAPAVPAVPVQERLDRVRADLFGRAEHVTDDVQELKDVLAIDPRSTEAHVLLGIAYSTLGSRDLKGEALAEFRQALDLDPSLVPVRFYLARLYLDLGRPARAREELDTALAQAPAQPDLLTLLGEAHRQLKDPAHAEDVLRQALKANESFTAARYYLALALIDQGKRDEAIKQLEQVVSSNAPQTDAYLALGNAYVAAGRSTEALATLTRGVQLDPSRPDLHVALAHAYRSKGLLTKAEAELALGAPKPNSAAASPGYPYQQAELDYQLERGMIALQRGQLTVAAEAFNKVLDIEPAHAAATRELAEVNRRLRAKKAGGGR